MRESVGSRRSQQHLHCDVQMGYILLSEVYSIGGGAEKIIEAARRCGDAAYRSNNLGFHAAR